MRRGGWRNRTGIRLARTFDPGNCRAQDAWRLVGESRIGKNHLRPHRDGGANAPMAGGDCAFRPDPAAAVAGRSYLSPPSGSIQRHAQMVFRPRIHRSARALRVQQALTEPMEAVHNIAQPATAAKRLAEKCCGGSG